MNDDGVQVARNGDESAPETSGVDGGDRSDDVDRSELRRLRHDARGALNHILGFTAILHEEAEEEGRDSSIRDLAKVAKAGRLLLGLVDRLADLALERCTQPSGQEPAEVTTRTFVDSAPPKEAPKPRNDDETQGTLLVVDDLEANRDVLARRLRRRSYDIETAESGPKALEAVAARPFDLVLLDVMMPEMDGFELLERLRQNHDASSLPVIMVTARNASEDVVKALERGANDYVTKPLDLPVVLARIATQLSLKRSHDEVQRLNERLYLAQERISRLADSSKEALQDIETWSARTAEELARAIEVDSIAVWFFNGEELVGVTEPGSTAPSTADLQTIERSKRQLSKRDEIVVPILGLSGDLFGALVVTMSSAMLGKTNTRILGSFARQLGGALELRLTQKQLSRAAERRRHHQEELLSQGVDVLKLCPLCGRCYEHNVEYCEADKALLSTPPTFPYRVGNRYRLVRVLGQGGMGMVFEAYDERLERKVALKVIRSEHFHNEIVRLRFEKEARAVASIDHPGVIAVFDCGEIDDGAQYLVMELLRGADVASLVACGGPGTPRQIAALLRQGSEALVAAHQAGIIHRDIKPDNLFLVTKEGSRQEFETKILDFGVAKEVNANTQLTQTGMLVGTPLFMSPEQILGRTVDLRADIYSFAAATFLALVGRRVTLEEKFVNVMLDVCHKDPPLVSSFLDNVPSEVDQAFASALNRDPEKRPESATAWVESFVAPLESMPSSVAGWNEETFIEAAARHNLGSRNECNEAGVTKLERRASS